MLVKVILPSSERVCGLCFKDEWEQDLLCNSQNDHGRVLDHELRISKRWQQSVKPTMRPCVTTQVACPPMTDIEAKCPWVFFFMKLRGPSVVMMRMPLEAMDFKSFFSFPFFTWKKKFSQNCTCYHCFGNFAKKKWLLAPTYATTQDCPRKAGGRSSSLWSKDICAI